MMSSWRLPFVLCVASCAHALAEPVLLDQQFKLPPGFHIYKAADASLTGGSYDIAFDGQGRLLVGDGEAVRRLTDSNGDQVYDRQEVIAEGLGGRGPQGLLVYGDRLYAVGGDGIQLFSGYSKGGALKHEGRLGQPFNTGGDHAAHTVLRGLDGYIYFVCGDGGGVLDRKHITESSSPVIYERNGSVFRFDPDGEYWECISAGGRNAPSLGVNYLGEFFSFDSDMEWHVDLPWYRPVRLNHWAIGGDQGWYGVGALPPYYIDNLPPVMVVGRGSPSWGVFYEHNQFPSKYADSFLCCDYRWKSATTGGYNSSGRLVAFHLARDGASWAATMETLVEAKPAAVDVEGNGINFALVDVDVAPDGSVFVSDHNQGVWRIFYSDSGEVPNVVPQTTFSPRDLARTQPGSEWTRLALERLTNERGGLGNINASDTLGGRIRLMAEKSDDLRERLTAIRTLAPHFRSLGASFLRKLAQDDEPEIRAQAAWLYGIRRNENEAAALIELLADKDAFVRRRAAEALGRLGVSAANDALVAALGDTERPVRYAAMTAIAHRPFAEWRDLALSSDDPQVWMRALVACSIRREEPDPRRVGLVVGKLLDHPLSLKEDRLDLLRVLGLFREQIEQTAVLDRVHAHVLSGVNDVDRDLRWEHARLVGDYSIPAGVDPLLEHLRKPETQNVARFHIAQALSRIEDGCSESQAQQLLRWLVTTQEGWFAEFDGKGAQFPQFWSTVLDRIVDAHPATVAQFVDSLKPGSQLSKMAYGVLPSSDIGRRKLRQLLADSSASLRREIVLGLARTEVDKSFWSIMLRELSADDAESRKALADWIERNGVAIEEYSSYLRELEDGTLQGEQLIADRLLALLGQRREAERGFRALSILFDDDRDRDVNYRDQQVRVAVQERWQAWYRERFGVPYIPGTDQVGGDQLTDDDIHRMLVAGERSGDVARGRNVYLQASCFSCHGGIADKETAVFGPDLAGVTKRLKPAELADAIVYPSKQVAERFRNTLVITTDGKSLTGVLTERTDQQIVLVSSSNEVTRLPISDVEAVKSLETSPMPAKLLNRFDAKQIEDLLAFVRSL